jgi:hypothetical protein
MGGMFSGNDQNQAATANLVGKVGNAIACYLSPSSSYDNLTVEHYTESNKACVDAIKRTIESQNKKIVMDDLNVEDLLTKAVNSRTAMVFKYEWEHIPGKSEGKLKFFYLKIKNLNEVVGNDQVKLEIDLCFGARSFTLSDG